MNRTCAIALLFACALGLGVLVAVGFTACSRESAEDRAERERIERTVRAERETSDREVLLGRRQPEPRDSAPIGGWGNSGN